MYGFLLAHYAYCQCDIVEIVELTKTGLSLVSALILLMLQYVKS